MPPATATDPPPANFEHMAGLSWHKFSSNKMSSKLKKTKQKKKQSLPSTKKNGFPIFSF